MSAATSISLIILAGVLSGTFSYPVTRVKEWDFEHIWSMGALAALLLLPWPLVYLFVPDVDEIYAQIPAEIVVIVVLCGIAWGIGGIFWGRAINALGLALGVSLMMSLINVFGSIGPVSIFQPELLQTPGGVALIIALIILILGVAVISFAGGEKEKELAADPLTDLDSVPRIQRGRKRFMFGLTCCVISGVLSAGVNFGLIAGAPIAEESVQHGVPVFARSFAIWSLVFTANYLVNVFYGVSLMIRRRTVRKLFEKGRPSYWLSAIFMGIAWPGGIIIYGIGAAGMGPYGAYIGFPMMLLFSILTGNVAGLLNGEWRGTSIRTRSIMIIGIIVISVAFILLGYSNHLLSTN